jgi:replicative DNA helicase
MTTTREKVEQYLQGYGLKKSGGEYRFNSPFRPGADGMTCSIRFDGDENGAWNDHKEGIGGSLYDFAQRAGLELPVREKVVNSKRGYESLAEYAGVKGIPEQAFIDAGWRQITYYDHRPCFQFPTLGGLRYRFIDGEKPSFKSITGFKTCWYGLDRAVLLAQRTSQPLILCNGEPSTIVAQYHGIAAFCKPGGEDNNLPSDLITELKNKWTGEVMIALDCDEAGHKGTQKFTEALTGADIKHTVVDLMLSDKGDLADFCKLHGESTLKDLSALPRMGLAHVVARAQEKPADIQTLAALAKELITLRKTEERPAELPLILEHLQDEIYHLQARDTIQITQSWEQVADEYKTWVGEHLKHAGQVQGFDSGLKKLNELLCGLERGRVFVLLAETGIGKSTTVASIASHLMNQAPGMVIPTETRAINMLNKIVAYRTGIPSHIMRQGRLTPNQAGLVYSTTGIIKQHKGQVIECQHPTTKQILATVRRSVAETSCQWIILDSLSNVKAPEAGGIFDHISEAADCAQELARMGLMVLCTSQVGRNLGNNRANRMPTLHDGKGSGRIEENADVVLGLYNHGVLVKRGLAEPSDEFPSNTICIRSLKDREYGDKEGELIQLGWRGGVGVFDEVKHD